MTKEKERLLEKLLNYETVSYLIAGVLTTVVDYAVFILVNEALKGSGLVGDLTAGMIATAAAWVAAVLFAYVVNKIVVFRSFSLKPTCLLKEFSAFVAARGVSGVLTLLMMWVMMDALFWNEYLAKLITSVFNVVFNYVASKLYIFKKA